MFNEIENIDRVQNKINQLIAQSDKSIFVIIDGDRTLIPTDSTKYFFEHLELSFSEIKTIFQEFGYSFEAFYRVALFYSEIEEKIYNKACVFSANSVTIYAEFLTFIHSIKQVSELILVTSGIKQSWQNVINNHSLDFMHLIGGSYLPSDGFVIDKNAKGIIADSLKKAGKKVFAFGDTLIDFDMLKEANHSYLVVNEKMNKDIIPSAYEIPHLHQISFSKLHHPNLPLTNLNDISTLIQYYHAKSIR